ncbi:MAG: lysophospholipid acyltransferase family protein [Peptostreptococcaceae bacterium]|nr:lysophospholipid acyltransferase family protein [Peptostreptococcaceae bacterium]
MYYVLKYICRLISLLIFRVHITGRENIPTEGAFLVAANHLSILDPVIISFITPRPIHFMAKAELFRTKFTKWLFGSVKTIKVERGANDISAIKKSLTVLKKGEILGLFPEGTRTKGKNSDVTVKSGAIMLAHRAKVKILPVAIRSDYKLFSKVEVRILPLFDPEVYLIDTSDYDQAANHLLETIYEGVEQTLK